MCGRYWIEKTPRTMEVADEMMKSPLINKWIVTTGFTTCGEIRPTDVVPVIAPDRVGNRAVFPMKWGFSGQSLIINARSETAAEKPMFREAWQRHRCIIPASWYFEWEHLVRNDGRKNLGSKYMIQPSGADEIFLCGLYRIENGLPVFVILTREPGEEIRFIHDRMPVILPEERIGEWIRPDGNPERLLGEALTDMVYEETG